MRINRQALNQVQEDLGNLLFKTTYYTPAFKNLTDIPFPMEAEKGQWSLTRNQLGLSMEYLLEGEGDKAYQILQELEDSHVKTFLQSAYQVAKEKGYLPSELPESQKEFPEPDRDVLQKYDNLGDLLRDFRKKRKLTQEEVASEIPISQNYLSEIENNRSEHPSDRVLRLLSHIYRVDWRTLKNLREKSI